MFDIWELNDKIALYPPSMGGVVMSRQIESVYHFDYTRKIGYYNSFRNFDSYELLYIGLALSTPEIRVNASPTKYKITHTRSSEIKEYVNTFLLKLTRLEKETAESKPEYIMICYEDEVKEYFEYNADFCSIFQNIKEYARTEIVEETFPKGVPLNSMALQKEDIQKQSILPYSPPQQSKPVQPKAKKYGMKWYNFYVKIRPWIAIVITFFSLLSTLTDAIPHLFEEVNKKTLTILLVVVAFSFTEIVLQFRVFIASSIERNKLLKYIKDLLFFEVVSMGYYVIFDETFKNVKGLESFLLLMVAFVIGHFVWYKPNLKYFEKRLGVSAPVIQSAPKAMSSNSESKQVYKPASQTTQNIVVNSPKQAKPVPFVESSNLSQYSHKSFDEKRIHRTLNGDYVRSKSEVIIANMLFEAGIKYEYEKELDLGKDGVRIPDFTIELPEKGFRFFWEHCGMLSDYAYQRRWEQKKELYRKHNIIEGQNLIVSQDLPNGGIDSAEIKRLIDTYLR